MKESEGNILAQLSDDFKLLLDKLTNAYIIRESNYKINDQCQSQFNCSWNTIRERVFNDLELISLWHTPTENDGGASESGLNENSGYWMINKLLLLHSFKVHLEWDNCKTIIPSRNWDGSDVEHTIHDEKNEQLESLIQNSIATGMRISAQENIAISPLLVGNVIKQTLASHGITLIERTLKI